MKNYLKIALRMPNDWLPCVLSGHYIGPGQNAITFFFDGSRTGLHDAQHAAQLFTDELFSDAVALDLPRSVFPALVSTWRSVPGGPPAVGSTNHAKIGPIVGPGAQRAGIHAKRWSQSELDELLGASDEEVEEAEDGGTDPL